MSRGTDRVRFPEWSKGTSAVGPMNSPQKRLRLSGCRISTSSRTGVWYARIKNDTRNAKSLPKIFSAVLLDFSHLPVNKASYVFGADRRKGMLCVVLSL